MCEKFVVMEINNEEKIDGGNIKLNAVALLVKWQNAGKYKRIYFESYLPSNINICMFS